MQVAHCGPKYRKEAGSGLSISFLSEVSAALAGPAPSPFPTTSIWNPVEKKSLSFSSYGQAGCVENSCEGERF